jgi:multiple sugar transport system substrate-binding protein
MLKRAGFDAPPKTWDELSTMSKAIMQKGLAKYGLVWAGSAAEGLVCDYVLMMDAFGGKYQDDSGKWIINQGGGLAALQYMVDSIHKDKFADPASQTLDDRTNRNSFAAGDVAFILNWASAWKQFTDPGSSQVSSDARIALVPGTSAGKQSSTCTGGSGFGIAQQSQNKDTAWNFITTMIGNEDAQRQWLKNASQIPTLKTVYNDSSLFQDNPQFTVLRQQMDFGFGRPEVPWYGDWSRVVQLELNRAIVGDKTPKQALDDAVQQLNDLQSQNKAA